MVHDEKLAQRLRRAVSHLEGTDERKMMGGLCVMLNGNMLAGCDRTKAGEGRFMFRVGKDNHDEALQRPGARPMIQGGRVMGGLVFVREDACDDAALAQWVSLAHRFVGALRPK